MYKINFNHLYYFLTIAKEGSIVKASKKLNMTQPAISHQLKLLETDLGKKLFHRKGRRLILNQEGEVVMEYANKIFRHSEEMIQSLKAENIEIIKIIKVGAVPWLSKDQIYQFLKPLLNNPHISLEVFEKDLETLIKDVQDNKLDIILCDSPYSGRSKKLQGNRISIDPIICVTSNKKNIKGKFPQSINDKKAILYPEACIMNDKIDVFIKKNKINLKVIGTFSDSTLMKICIEKTNAIGFLPLSVIRESLKQKTLFKVGELGEFKFSMWAITKKDIKKDSLIFNLIKKS